MAILLAVASIYFTNNRSVFFGTVFLLSVFVGALVWQRRIKFAILWAFGLLSAGIALFFLNWRGAMESPLAAIDGGRLPQWHIATALFFESPLLGWNLGSSEPHQAFLRLAGELGTLAAVAVFLLFLKILFKQSSSVVPRRALSASFTPSFDSLQDRLWPLVAKTFLLVVLAMGTLTDSLTPVLSWDLVAFCVGMAWFSYQRNQRPSTPALVAPSQAGRRHST